MSSFDAFKPGFEAVNLLGTKNLALALGAEKHLRAVSGVDADLRRANTMTRSATFKYRLDAMAKFPELKDAFREHLSNAEAFESSVRLFDFANQIARQFRKTDVQTLARDMHFGGLTCLLSSPARLNNVMSHILGDKLASRAVIQIGLSDRDLARDIDDPPSALDLFLFAPESQKLRQRFGLTRKRSASDRNNENEQNCYRVDVRQPRLWTPQQSQAPQSFAKEPNIVLLWNAVSDEASRKNLEKHMRLLQRARNLEIFHKDSIMPGDNSNEVFREKLYMASLIVLLVSIDLLIELDDSELNMLRECMQQSKIIRVPLRSVHYPGGDYSHRFLEQLPILPENGISLVDWDDEDRFMADVVRSIDTTFLPPRTTWQ